MCPSKKLCLTASNSNFLCELQLLFGALCLALGVIFIKLAHLQPATISFLRCIIALPFLILLSAREIKKIPKNSKLEKNLIAWSFISGIVIGIQYIVYAICVDITGAGISSILANCQIFFFPILALLIDKEPISKTFWIFSPILLVGLSASAGLFNSKTDGITDPMLGFITGMLSGITYAIFLFLNRRCTRKNPRYIITYNTLATVGAATICIISAPLMQGFTLNISAISWIWVILLALFAQVLSWIIIARGSHKLSPNKASSLLTTYPIMALLLGIIFLSETMNTTQAIGCIIVVICVWIINKEKNNNKSSKQTVINTKIHGEYNGRKNEK